MEGAGNMFFGEVLSVAVCAPRCEHAARLEGLTFALLSVLALL
jgi:hypothetical protein